MLGRKLAVFPFLSSLAGLARSSPVPPTDKSVGYSLSPSRAPEMCVSSSVPGRSSLGKGGRAQESLSAPGGLVRLLRPGTGALRGRQGEAGRNVAQDVGG
jgi:hypothetical protein